MDIIRRNYPDMPQPSGAFHHSVRFGNMLFIAGSTARGTSAETRDIAAQAEVILQKFQTILEANSGSVIRRFSSSLRSAIHRHLTCVRFNSCSRTASLKLCLAASLR